MSTTTRSGHFEKGLVLAMSEQLLDPWLGLGRAVDTSFLPHRGRELLVGIDYEGFCAGVVSGLTARLAHGPKGSDEADMCVEDLVGWDKEFYC